MVSAPSDGHVGRRRAASLGYRDDYMIVPLGKQEGGIPPSAPSALQLTFRATDLTARFGKGPTGRRYKTALRLPPRGRNRRRLVHAEARRRGGGRLTPKTRAEIAMDLDQCIDNRLGDVTEFSHSHLAGVLPPRSPRLRVTSAVY